MDLQDGGFGRIAVSDDGRGIPAAEVELAFERHATSKLSDDTDLQSLQTLGFRGEALPSIASAGDITLSTRAVDEAVGTLVTYRGGKLVDRRSVGRGAGTSVEVTDLFARQPARRKFMRQPSAEAARAVQAVGQLALACPDIAFQVTVDGRSALSTDGAGEISTVARSLLGHAVAADLLVVDWTPSDDERNAPRIRGLVGHRAAHRANRSGQSFFVNRRWVQSRLLGVAVDETFRTLVPTGRHPIAILDIRLPESDVDVNVHPTKAEVRLLREGLVFDSVRRAIHQTLAQAGVARSWQSGEDGHDGEAETHLRGLRVLGQAGLTYIIAEGEAGVYLVDQHAAHERVLYEEMSLAQLGGTYAQPLLQPLPLDVSHDAVALVEAHRSELAANGFDLEPFGETVVLLRSVPVVARALDSTRLAREVIESLLTEQPTADWRDRVRVVASCKAAVRAGDSLTQEEMLGLLVRLGEKDLCRTCSHGRPTALLLSHRQLEREFGRS